MHALELLHSCKMPLNTSHELYQQFVVLCFVYIMCIYVFMWFIYSYEGKIENMKIYLAESILQVWRCSCSVGELHYPLECWIGNNAAIFFSFSFTPSRALLLIWYLRLGHVWLITSNILRGMYLHIHALTSTADNWIEFYQKDYNPPTRANIATFAKDRDSRQRKTDGFSRYLQGRGSYNVRANFVHFDFYFESKFGPKPNLIMPVTRKCSHLMTSSCSGVEVIHQRKHHCKYQAEDKGHCKWKWWMEFEKLCSFGLPQVRFDFVW